MRWPLKYQIMAPMTVVVLGAVATVSACQAYLAAKRTRQQTAARVRTVCGTLVGSAFPMTGAVLLQMKGLSGADFVLLDSDGKLMATTRDDWRSWEPAFWSAMRGPSQLELAEPISIRGERLFQAAITIRPSAATRRASTLHVFYPESAFLADQRRAVLPALGIGAVATVLVVVLTLLIASRVSRPLSELRHQVNRIAAGGFQPIALPLRRDEVRELAVAFNQMSETLARYEQEVRRAEQVRLLAQLGGGLAHQLRNSATGARMALDIHRCECGSAEKSESLDVATRQLELLEKHLARLLTLSASRQRVLVDVAQLVHQVLPLVQPAAQHTGVVLRAEIPAESIFVRGDPDALEQMVLNVMINAVEAAGQSISTRASAATPWHVRIRLRQRDAGCLELIVEDTGPGPPAEIAQSMFEPFVTAKQNGVGLGLAVVRDVVRDHDGQLHWERTAAREQEGTRTRFWIELPIAAGG